MEQSKGYRRRWIALGFLTLSLFIISVDNTVVNLALTSIAKDLGASASGLQWIVDAYILFYAALLLTTGSIGDRFGRKRILQVGLVIFGFFSLGAALAKSTDNLIIMRALMGVGAAAIMPSSLSILTATFRNPKERAQAIAIWSAVYGLGLGIGPLIAGALLEHFSWSSIFYVNIPIVIIALIGGQFFIENSKAENPRKTDVPGVILSISGLLALVYAIIQAGVGGWTAPDVLFAFGVAAVLFTVFALWEARTKNAMLPLGFFKNMSFTGANIALTFVAFALMGCFFFLGQYLLSVQGYTPLQAGVRLLPMAGTFFVAAVISARVAQRVGTKYTVALGIIIAAIGFFYFSRILAVNTNYGQFVLGAIISSLGMGLVMSPATNSIMGSIPVSQAGVGSAMNNTTRQVGGALGVAVLGTLMNSTYIASINKVNWPVQLPARVIEVIRSGVQEAQIAAQNVHDAQLSTMINNEARMAFTSGMVHALVVAAVVMAVVAIITLVILPVRIRAPKKDD